MLNERYIKRMQRGGFTPKQILLVEKTIDDAQKELEERYTKKSFLMTLALPLNVLISDIWSEEEAKEKAPEFIDSVISLMETYSANGISYEELAAFVKEYAGVDFQAPWLKERIGQ